MAWTSFLTSFLPQKRETEPEPLPLVHRMATLEADMFELRTTIDAVQGSMRKLSGKVYRGVSLGDTTVDEVPEGPMDETPSFPTHSKTELYRRAASLRRPPI